MITVILIDDEPLARGILKEYLQEYPDFSVLAECGDGFEAIKAIGKHKPDLIFLDVQMPKISGFELLEVLDEPPAIIFTTAFEEYAIRAFEKHAVDYLLKPISKPRFDQALEKYRNIAGTAARGEKLKEILSDAGEQQGYVQRILIKTHQNIKIIPVDQVVLLAADDDYVNVHTAGAQYLKNKTLSFYEKNLDPAEFVRVHRSYIIRLDQLTRIEPYEKDSQKAILKNNQSVPVSKTGYPKLMRALGN